MDIVHMAKDANLSTVRRITSIPKYKALVISENTPITLLKAYLIP
jgi:hypothetical protein